MAISKEEKKARKVVRFLCDNDAVAAELHLVGLDEKTAFQLHQLDLLQYECHMGLNQVKVGRKLYKYDQKLRDEKEYKRQVECFREMGHDIMSKWFDSYMSLDKKDVARKAFEFVHASL